MITSSKRERDSQLSGLGFFLEGGGCLFAVNESFDTVTLVQDHKFILNSRDSSSFGNCNLIFFWS